MNIFISIILILFISFKSFINSQYSQFGCDKNIPYRIRDIPCECPEGWYSIFFPNSRQTHSAYYFYDAETQAVTLKFGQKVPRPWTYVNEKWRTLALNLTPQFIFELGARLTDPKIDVETDIKFEFSAARTFNPSYLVVRYFDDLLTPVKMCIDPYVRPPGHTIVEFIAPDKLICRGASSWRRTSCGRCNLPPRTGDFPLGHKPKPFIIEKIVMQPNARTGYQRSRRISQRQNLNSGLKARGNAFTLIGNFYYIAYQLDGCVPQNQDQTTINTITYAPIPHTYPTAQVFGDNRNRFMVYGQTNKLVSFSTPRSFIYSTPKPFYISTIKPSHATLPFTKMISNTFSTTLSPLTTRKQSYNFSNVCGFVNINATFYNQPTPSPRHLLVANSKMVVPHSFHNGKSIFGGSRKSLNLVTDRSYGVKVSQRPFLTEWTYVNGYGYVKTNRGKRSLSKLKSQLPSTPRPKNTNKGRILGGVASVRGAWPWQASIRLRGRHLCGGFLISDKHIVSAAHCFAGIAINELTIHLGTILKSDKDIYEQSRTVAKLFRHLFFNKGTKYDNDVALIHMSESVKLNQYVSPLCLPSKKPSHEDYCQVTGYGATKNTGNDSILNEIAVPLIRNKLCNDQAWLNGRVSDNMICAGGDMVDACEGDSGGALACVSNDSRWYATGIVSWGIDCGRPQRPGVYTRLYNYVRWIRDKMNA